MASFKQRSYICSEGHITRSWEWAEKVSIRCGKANKNFPHKADTATCRKRAYQVGSPQATKAQPFQPFVYFKSADGKTSIPGRADDPVPPGMVRCEVRNFRERDRFYKEQNQAARDDWERTNQQQYEAGEAYLSEQRAQLFHDMQHFSPQGRALAEHAIKKANERPAPSYQANSFIEAFEMDRGNREAHRDPSGKRWY